MTGYAIQVQGVSKKYRLFRSNQERVLEALHPLRKTYHREFWALRDINLEIPLGSTVGILGLNGSGKSTLLQIICSVLKPTTGTVTVNGKVAALLELGAGLNPELSGRENVVMSSTIMGYDSERTLQRMEEIESFADIGEFFDQPMKTYSSGMYMRVAFATSIFVDPDVLIIDEALSVGDAKFAEKCFSKIRKFRDDGKSILIVTHDRTTVPRICDFGVLLHRGRLVETGPANRIVDLYAEVLAFGDLVQPTEPGAAARSSGVAAGPAPERQVAEATATPLQDRILLEHTTAEKLAQNPLYNKYEYRYGNSRASIEGFCVVQDGVVNPTVVRNHRAVEIIFRASFREAVHTPLAGMTITSSQGVVLYSTHTGWMGIKTRPAQPGDVRHFSFTFQPRLIPGDWFIELAIAANPSDMCDVRSKVAHLSIMGAQTFGGLAMIDTEFREIA